MGKIIAALVLLAVLGAFLWGVYFYNAHKFTNTSWREKLTLTIETPAGEVTGAAVVEVTARCGKPMIGNEVFYRVIGEATVVEVTPGRYLFVPLYKSGDRFYLLAQDRFKGLRRCDWLKLIPKQTDTITLIGTYRPRLLTFNDLNDTTSVKLVDPDDLATTFGAGVRLKSVELAITTEPVTDGKVQALLGWLGPYPEPALLREDGRTSDIPLAMQLHHGDFIQKPH